MNNQGFIAKYKTDRPIFEAWGQYIIDQIKSQLLIEFENTNKLELYLRIPPSCRIKEESSLLAKAFCRGKNYNDPYNDITDKVGVRFVVLLISDIRKITNIIENINEWTYSKDKDFEDEKLSNPHIFVYQSVHYVVKNKHSITYNDNTIPANTSCEIQVRTLLQHAYSELTHDTTYKPKVRTTPDISREIAKSMALIESTDDIFMNVDNKLTEINNKVNEFQNKLLEIYSKYLKSDYNRDINNFILDAYWENIKTIDPHQIEKFILSNDYILGNIKKRYDNKIIFRQPIVLLIYFLINHDRVNTSANWPLTEEELKPFFTDLGISL